MGFALTTAPRQSAFALSLEELDKYLGEGAAARPVSRKRVQADFDDLFVAPPDADGRYCALWFGEAGDSAMYVAGYENASEMLFKRIAEEGADNAIVYPLLMLARHTVEISFKDALQETDRSLRYGGLESQIDTSWVWSTHNFGELTKVLEREIAPIVPLHGEPWVRTRAFLFKWERADPDGNFARYGREVGGKPVSVKGNVYIGTIWPQARHARDYLYGVTCGLERYRDGVREERDAYPGP